MNAPSRRSSPCAPVHRDARDDARERRADAKLHIVLGPNEAGKSCALAANPDHCDIFHAEDTEYWTDVWYWTTPTEECIDGRTDVKCVGYDEWVRAWSALRSS